MAEPQHHPSSTSLLNWVSSDASSSSSELLEDGDERNLGEVQNLFHFRNAELEPHRGNISVFEDSPVIRDETWSCLIFVLSFCLLVSMTLVLGVYGASTLSLGPNSSILIQPSPIFVHSVEVAELEDTKPGLALYSFHKSPPLDVVAVWSKTYNVAVAANSHKEWVYYLNMGSEINIAYSLSSSNSSIFLIIAQGSEGLSQWLEDPTYPNTALSWNVISGNGMVQQYIYQSSSYYVALGNMNLDRVEVQLNISVKALLYNTSDAYYKCTFNHGLCTADILFPNGNTILLTSPGPERGAPSDELSVRLSYEPRWITYILGIGGITAIMLLAFNFLNKFQFSQEVVAGQRRDVGSERAYLLSNKDDEVLSRGSSYDSLSHDEGDIDESGDGETSNNNSRRLCGICFDGPRDCFFLPCGHCVACYDCGTRIMEAAGACPVCHRSIKKVRTIFTV